MGIDGEIQMLETEMGNDDYNPDWMTFLIINYFEYL